MMKTKTKGEKNVVLRKKNYRDLDRWKDTARKQKRRYYKQTETGKGMPRWTYEEDALIMVHNETDTELAHKIGRSVAAIQKRRWYLKKFVFGTEPQVPHP